MEKIIKFPFPEYNECFDNKVLLNKPYCLCYQYDIKDNSQYGPYGFETAKSQSLLQKVFSNVYFWNQDKQDLVEMPIDIRKQGIYLYGSMEIIEQTRKEILTYRLCKKKNEYLKKDDPIGNMPILLRIFDNHKYNANGINQFIEDKINFFIVQFFTPEAGNSLVLFDDSVWEAIKNIALQEAVNTDEVQSINELKAW